MNVRTGVCCECSSNFTALNATGPVPLRCAACLETQKSRYRRRSYLLHREKRLAEAKAYWHERHPEEVEKGCARCGTMFTASGQGRTRRIMCDACQTIRSRELKAEYKTRNRERTLADARTYAERKRREAGWFERGSPESAARLRARPTLTGADHPNWKGDEAGYAALHAWLYRRKTRTGVCSDCGDRPKPYRNGRAGTEFHNISGEYRRDISDWAELCRRCHSRAHH
jgi:hypothetical protein